MSVGFVKSIAVLFVGTGFALSQSSPAPAVGKVASRGSLNSSAPQADVRYPQTSGQKSYTASSEAEVNGHGTVPDSAYGGVDWGTGEDHGCRVYVDAEYLLWRVRSPSLPSLTTVIPAGIAAIPQRTVIDGLLVPLTAATPVFLVPFTLSSDPGFPSQTIDLSDRNGGRLTVGAWFDADMDLGIEASGFWTEKLTQQSRATSLNVTNQFTLDTGVQTQFFITNGDGTRSLQSTAEQVIPAQGSSDLFVAFASQLSGGEVNLRAGCCRVGGFTLGGLLGTRYIHFKEAVQVHNVVNVIDLPGETTGSDLGVLPATFRSQDRIQTRNQIIAPQLGVDMEFKCYGCFLDVTAKVAIGANFQDISAAGSAISTTVGGGTRATVGGLLTGPSDQGTIHRTRVSFIPELNLKLGYEVTNNSRVYIGYDAMSMQHIVRPGQQVAFTNIQTQLQVASSATQIGVRQPIIEIHDQDTWVQGLNFGFELRY